MAAKGRAFGLRGFLAHRGGFSGAFRINVRAFLREYAEAEEAYVLRGMPVWRVLLVDERSGIAVPIYVVEEDVKYSSKPFCDHCRCSGWSHHFVSKRRYHFMIPPDRHWGDHLREDCFDNSSNLLHGIIHCNGYGHLVCINGRGGGSKHVSGREIMDIWDRICTSLRTREVTVEDLSHRGGMQLRLLLGIAYGSTWFSLWGYRFHLGSFGVSEQLYIKSIDLLASQDLHHLIKELEPTGRDRDLRRIIFSYVNLNDHLRFSTVRSLLRHLLDLQSQTKIDDAPPPSTVKTSRSAPSTKSHKRCRDFDKVVAELDSRWSVKRLHNAAVVVVHTLLVSGKKSLTRQEVRDAARLVVGDTGLLDFVLKSIGDCIISNHVVRRIQNPSTRVLEFSIELKSEVDAAEWLPPPRKIQWQKNQVEQDLLWLYRHVLQRGPLGANVLNGKRWVKTWPLRDEEDDRLRYLCTWIPGDDEVIRPELLTRPLPPPEVVVMPPHASLGDLRKEAEGTLRDTYCIMEGFTATRVDGVVGEEWEPLFGAGESGSAVWVSGEGVDWGATLRYEGGEENWTVECSCGARDDDGERMVACDVCETWQHTRCVGIEDGAAVPQTFLCARCAATASRGMDRRLAIC